MVAADPQTEIVGYDIVEDDRFRPVLDIGPAEIALIYGLFLVPVDHVITDTGASVCADVAMHDNRARAPQVDAVRVTWNMMILLR